MGSVDNEAPPTVLYISKQPQMSDCIRDGSTVFALVSHNIFNNSTYQLHINHFACKTYMKHNE